jgi:hypothetical protein
LDYNRMASNRRSQFLFLNHPFSSGPLSQREKELQDADRRAHAARHSRSQRHSPPTDNAASSKAVLKKRSNRHLTDRVGLDARPPVKPSRKKHLVVRPRTPKVEGESSTQVRETPLTSVLSLGQGNHDPFNTSAVSGLPPFIDGVLDHCK